MSIEISGSITGDRTIVLFKKSIESEADSLESIVLELLQSKTSERQGRAIDADSSNSMEKKKLEGYF